MKLIKRGNNVGIDKKEFDKLIAAKNFIGLNKSPRAEKVIVSLTSYKPRIKGDYVLFMDEKTFLPKEALDIVAKVADDSKADVIHFAGHLQIIENSGNIVIDDAPELRRDRPIFFDSARQMRSALWLQNKLSWRLETKIFRRDFLTKHGLTFSNNITEFLFQALIDAEKYLLVPQAFSFSKE